MATARQKAAARQNIVKARQAQSARARGKDVPHSDEGLILAAAKRYDVEVSESSWRDLAHGGDDRK